MNNYFIVSILLAVLSCGVVYYCFEKKKISIAAVVVMAVFTSFAVLGRIAFFEFPGFKPVTAIVIMSGIYFGKSGGFMVGSLSALISNIYFGQGPWTPFQMVTWGLIGIIAGIFSGLLKKNSMFLYLFAVFSGVFYSMFMDIFTVLSMEGKFNFKLYCVSVAAAVPYMLIYSVANVFFLFVLEKPFRKKIDRIKKKYGDNIV